MIASKKDFYTGLGLLACFVVIFVIIFMPVFNQQNGLDYLDSLYTLTVEVKIAHWLLLPRSCLSWVRNPNY